MLAVCNLFPSTYKIWKTILLYQWQKREECEGSWVFYLVSPKIHLKLQLGGT